MNATQQVFLKPGKYHIGGGKFHEFTADDLREAADNTRKMMADGHGVPVLLEHAEPGSDEGSPRDKKAEKIKNGAGWLAEMAVNENGEAAHTLEIGDDEIAKKIEQGTIRYTSPEFRRRWTDGKGRTYENIISHVALTHKPRHSEQDHLAIQMSLEEYEPIQMGDDDETGDESKDSGNVNPDLNGGGDIEKQQQFDAVRALLVELGIDLPADTNHDTLVRDLLTALKTFKVAMEKAAADKGATSESDSTTTAEVDNSGAVQYSLADTQVDDFANKQVAKLCQYAAKDVRSRAAKLVADKRISKAVGDRLTAAEVLQFSDEGDLLASLSIDDVLEILSELPENLAMSLADIEVQDTHPEYSFFNSGESDELDDGAAAKEVERIAGANPGICATK